MANTELKRKMNIGSSSLILIFIVLCLGTFGLLSLTNASGDLKLAKKNAGAVRSYYEADGQGEAFVQMVDQTRKEVLEETQDPSQQQQLLLQRLGEYYRSEDEVAWTDIVMDFDQALHIELKLNGENPLHIQSWMVYQQQTYDIDDSMPVWTGEE